VNAYDTAQTNALDMLNRQLDRAALDIENAQRNLGSCDCYRCMGKAPEPSAHTVACDAHAHGQHDHEPVDTCPVCLDEEANMRDGDFA